MEQLLDFDKPLDVGLLDSTVNAFYTSTNQAEVGSVRHVLATVPLVFFFFFLSVLRPFLASPPHPLPEAGGLGSAGAARSRTSTISLSRFSRGLALSSARENDRDHGAPGV